MLQVLLISPNQALKDIIYLNLQKWPIGQIVFKLANSFKKGQMATIRAAVSNIWLC